MIHYLSFSDLFDNANKSIHVVHPDGKISFFVAEYYSAVYMYNIFIHSSVNGHLGCFNDLTTVNNAGVNISMSFQISVFGFFGYTPNSVIIFDKDNGHSEQLNNCT